ncbi:MAG: siderophore-interacting protein [Ancrocorticia sp.]
MPKTSRRMIVNPLSLREVRVARTVDVTPGMKRVTLVGEQLGAFTSANGLEQPAFDSPAFDESFRLVFPYPGETEPVLPVQTETGLSFPRESYASSRVYTVRRWDAEAGELDVDFVKHGIGVATTWAYRAQPGDRIHMFGPGVSHGMPQGMDWWLVAGDDTALPAIGRLLEELPEDSRAQVFIEMAEESHRQQLRELPGVEVTWLFRNGKEPGTTSLLLDAVKSTDWWDGKPFAWIAGEQSAVRDIRRHLVEQRHVPKADIDFTGYWKRSKVVPLTEDAALPDVKNHKLAHETFHDLVELYPPIAIRTAVTLGIGDLISRSITTLPELAAKSGSDERALGKLLRYLHSLDLLTETAPGNYKLTEVGEFMADEHWISSLHADSAGARQDAGIFGLTEAIHTGKASYPVVTGQSFDELRDEQWYEDKYLDDVSGFIGFLVTGVVDSRALDQVGHVVIHAAGAGVFARELTAAYPDLRISICARPTQADWLRRDLPESIPFEAQRSRVSIREQSILDPVPECDAVLYAQPRMPLPDAEAVTSLRQAAAALSPGGRVLLIEHTFDLNDLDEHDCETDLQGLTRDGGGIRTDAELEAVIEQAGLRIGRQRPVARMFTLRELLPVQS